MGTVYTRGEDYSKSALFLVRTDGDPMRLAPAIRELVAQLEKDRVIRTIEPMEATLSEMLAPRRFVVILLGLFAGIALALAALGVYGIISHSVAQRTHEMGVRMALGAQPGDVFRLMLKKGLTLIVVGLVIGVAAALALARVLASLLYGVTPTDPMTFAAVSLLPAVIGSVACYIPARRATRIDPMTALRYE
jgi:putative ABC transport system permease protein